MVLWIIGVIAGLLLPIMVAIGIVALGMPKGSRASRGLTLAFGKGIGLGVIMGLLISALTIGLVLVAVRLSGR